MPTTAAKPIADTFWEAVGVFPEALRERSTDPQLTEQAVSLLTKLGRGNLRLLGERLNHSQSGQADARDMAKELVGALPKHVVPCLKEFQRNRIPEIEDIFGAAFGNEADTILSDLANLSRR